MQACVRVSVCQNISCFFSSQLDFPALPRKFYFRKHRVWKYPGCLGKIYHSHLFFVQEWIWQSHKRGSPLFPLSLCLTSLHCSTHLSDGPRWMEDSFSCARKWPIKAWSQQQWRRSSSHIWHIIKYKVTLVVVMYTDKDQKSRNIICTKSSISTVHVIINNGILDKVETWNAAWKPQKELAFSYFLEQTNNSVLESENWSICGIVQVTHELSAAFITLEVDFKFRWWVREEEIISEVKKPDCSSVCEQNR